MIKLISLQTGRPTWIDPEHVGAIADAVEVADARLAGAPPTVRVVGTTLIVQGATVHVQGDPALVAEQVEEGKARLGRRLNS